MVKNLKEWKTRFNKSLEREKKLAAETTEDAVTKIRKKMTSRKAVKKLINIQNCRRYCNNRKREISSRSLHLVDRRVAEILDSMLHINGSKKRI